MARSDPGAGDGPGGGGAPRNGPPPTRTVRLPADGEEPELSDKHKARLARELASRLSRAPRPADAAPALAPGAFGLAVVDGGEEGRVYPLAAQSTIGRAPDNTIFLPDPTVSKRHARIAERPEGGYTLEDNGSRNGTRVNGKRVSSQLLLPGDRITIGTTTLELRKG